MLASFEVREADGRRGLRHSDIREEGEEDDSNTTTIAEDFTVEDCERDKEAELTCHGCNGLAALLATTGSFW